MCGSSALFCFAMLFAVVCSFGSLHAQQPCPDYNAAEIASAVKSSQTAPSSVKERACMWGGAALAESDGSLCKTNGRNFGVFQLSAENVARLGYRSPAEYMAQSLQQQIDGWAAVGAFENNQSHGYRIIDSKIAKVLRLGHVLDGVLAACSQFGPVVCNNDMQLIESGIALPPADSQNAIRCKESSCDHGRANQSGQWRNYSFFWNKYSS